MKLCLAFAFAISTLAAQEIKHVVVPIDSSERAVLASALEVVRDLPYNGVIHLKGSVEIKMPVCIKIGPNNAKQCEGYVILRAEEADVHADSGKIDARGNVTVTREP
jgi:hypothetical protein